MLDAKLKEYWTKRSICLKDGTWVELTAEQSEWLTELIIYLPFESWPNKKIKVGEHVFTLDDIETDVDKVQKHKQNRLDF